MPRGVQWLLAALVTIVAACGVATVVQLRALRADESAADVVTTARAGASDASSAVTTTPTTALSVTDLTTTTAAPLVPPGNGREPRLGPARVVLWGDSLAAEAASLFQHAVERPERIAAPRTAGGTAPCDWYADIMQWPDTEPIDVALLQFSGNARTPCMRESFGVAPSLSARVEKYRADVEALALHLSGKGATVLLIGAPVFRSDFREPNRVEMFNELYRDLAERHDGVLFVDAGAPLLDQGRYTDRLPCLQREGEAEGCTDGTITVRSPDGVHFCPVVTKSSCPVYSSGALRFAMAMAEAAITPPIEPPPPARKAALR